MLNKLTLATSAALSARSATEATATNPQLALDIVKGVKPWVSRRVGEFLFDA
jgi:hypothetical protein